MIAAVVGETPHAVKFVGKLVARLMDAGIPLPGWIPRCAGGGTVETGKPLPFDLVAHFDGECGRRKIIARRADLNAKFLGRRGTSKKEGNDPDQPEGGIAMVRFH